MLEGGEERGGNRGEDVDRAEEMQEQGSPPNFGSRISAISPESTKMEIITAASCAELGSRGKRSIGVNHLRDGVEELARTKKWVNS